MIISIVLFVAFLLVIGYIALDDEVFESHTIRQQLDCINDKLGKILALVEIDQSVLDGYGTTLGAIASTLAAEIDALKVAVPSLPAANVAAIDAQIAALTALEPPAPAPPAPSAP